MFKNQTYLGARKKALFRLSWGIPLIPYLRGAGGGGGPPWNYPSLKFMVLCLASCKKKSGKEPQMRRRCTLLALPCVPFCSSPCLPLIFLPLCSPVFVSPPLLYSNHPTLSPLFARFCHLALLQGWEDGRFPTNRTQAPSRQPEWGVHIAWSFLAWTSLSSHG